MRISSLAAAAKIGFVLLLAQVVTAEAAEIKVLNAAFMKRVVEELGAQFERTTGHKLAIKLLPGPAVERAIEAGEPFDVAITQADGIDKLVKAGKIDAAGPVIKANGMDLAKPH